MESIKVNDYSFRVVGNESTGYVNIAHWIDGAISDRIGFEWVNGVTKQVYLSQGLIPRFLFKELKKQLPKSIYKQIPHEKWLGSILKRIK